MQVSLSELLGSYAMACDMTRCGGLGGREGKTAQNLKRTLERVTRQMFDSAKPSKPKTKEPDETDTEMPVQTDKV